MLYCGLTTFYNLNSMNMSDKSIEKRTIMDYLPEHERAKVRKLVQRLAQQTQQKQKYKKLYQQLSQQYEELSKKYEELEEYNNELKSQIATSKMAIMKAKQAYIASKSIKKLKRADLEGQADNQQGTNIENLKETWLKIPKSSQNFGSVGKNEYIFEENENSHSKSNSNLNNTTHKSIQKVHSPMIPLPLTTAVKKLTNTAINDTTLQSSSKKEQIMNLRKQIESLTEQMKKKEVMGLPLNEKIKKCQEIKNRYLRSKEKRKPRGTRADGSQQEQEEQRERDRQEEQEEQIVKQYANTRRNRIADASINRPTNTPTNGETGRNVDKAEHESQKMNKSEAGSQLSNKISGSSYRHQPRKNEPQSQKFDQSLFAIIDQLNYGN